jgi:hypothetical protein
MDQHGRRLNIKTLWAVVLIGIAYSILLYFQGSLTGSNKWDGIFGVVLGLYICSHPAANVVDLLFFRRGAQRQFSSKRSIVFWLVFNILVLLVGWLVIFLGTTRIVSTTD